MPKDTLRILLIEDDPGDALLLREMLAEEKDPAFEVTHAGRLQEGLDFLSREAFDVILTDLDLPDSRRMATFTQEQSKAPGLPIIILTGSVADEMNAREAVRAGAQDYLIKGRVNGKIVSRAIVYAIERKRLLQLRDDFVNIVSHELRAPLTTVRDGVSQILEGIHGQITPQQVRVLSMSLSNLDRLSRMATDLLDIARIEAGKMVLKHKDVDMAALIRQIAEQFGLRVKEKGLEIRVSVPEEGLLMKADTDKVIQIITNLVGNAIKFTEEGFIEISACEKDGTVECSVRDTGRGIAPEDLARIAEKFRQFGPSPQGEHKGAGLGLAITRALVDLHKGKLRIHSDFGKGSTFTITLPKTPQ